MALDHTRSLFTIIDRDREHLRQWQNWPDAILTLDDAYTMVDNARRKRRADLGLDLIIRYQGGIAGKIGLVSIDWHTMTSEIGYWIAAGHEGRGLVTRACVLLINHAFDVIGLNGVVIRVAEGNVRSRAVPGRLGFAYDGPLPYMTWLRGDRIQEVTYSMKAARWRMRHYSEPAS
jgi:ribosomal-protein-serine acetyltransferase